MPIPSNHIGTISSSPLGEIFFTIENSSLVYLRFGIPFVEYEKESIKIFGDFGMHHDEISEIQIEIMAYLNNNSPITNIQINISRLTDFQQNVLNSCCKIPYGTTSNYRQIGKSIGVEKGAQAVGQALKINPIPIVIPCHRVIGSDNSLGGYGGVMGSKDKIFLLKHENAILA